MCNFGQCEKIPEALLRSHRRLVRMEAAKVQACEKCADVCVYTGIYSGWNIDKARV